MTHDLTTPTSFGAELTGLAELVAALRHRAELPGVLIRLDSELGTNAEALGSHCSRTARIDLGAELLQEPASRALYGTIAHEIAHHALDHGQAALVRHYRAGLAKTGLLVGLALRLPFAVLVALAFLALVAHLAAARAARLEEYDADTYAVRLLDAVGLPGRRIVAAALADLPAESAGYLLAGWMFGSHPTPRARRRTLASGRPARRMRWALLWQHTAAPATARYGLAAASRTGEGQ
ncbi:M48 family metalloprotease [Streptomyces anulatus]|uniref:M48 family metalloprotease n=1 Tax=Streptomyces anulatus TaxID=1892 RepID=UPI00343AF912